MESLPYELMVKVMTYVDVGDAQCSDFFNLTSTSSYFYVFRNDMYMKTAWIIRNRGGRARSVVAVLDALNPMHMGKKHPMMRERDCRRMVALVESLVDQGGDVNFQDDNMW